MSIIKNIYSKKIVLFCISIVYLFMIVLPLKVNATNDSAEVVIRVDQTFIKNSTVSNVKSEFLYELIPVEKGNPMPVGSIGDVYSFTIDETSVFYTTPINFDKTGVYNYQIKGAFVLGESVYTYDEQVYDVAVYIKRPEQKDINATVIVKNENGDKVESARFENIYTPASSNSEFVQEPTVQKIISGNPTKATEFIFELNSKNIDNPMPSGSVNGIKNITVTGEGTKGFGTWTYSEEGTYYYTVYEVDKGESGYIYDKTIYTLTDTVKDKNGKLEVNRNITDASGKQVQICQFTNKYSKSITTNNTSNGLNESGTLGGVSRPKTGDNIKVELYFAVMGLSVITAAYLFFIIKHNKDYNEN